MPLAELAANASAWGYDGLELACWGDHFDVVRAAADPGYCADRRELLEAHGLGVWAISNHLVGQAVCDPIDDRHRAILPPRVWGDGDPEGVRARAAAEMKATARAAANLGVEVVNGFTGSSILASVVSVPACLREHHRRGLRRLRRALAPHPRRLRRGGRALRPRGASHRDRLRHGQRGASAGSHRQARGLRLQLRPQPSRLSGDRRRGVHPPLRRPHLPRACEGCVVGGSSDALRSLRRPPALRPPGSRMGLPLPPDAGRCLSRTSCAPSPASATTDRSPSNGKTWTWTASTAQGRPAPLYVPWTSRPRGPHLTAAFGRSGGDEG